MTNPLFFPSIEFTISVAQLKQLPQDIGHEVAFAGRSNAGKSTALNAITGSRNLARTSKTPGCTQLLNFFTIDEKRRLVDLPGYGYAKVPPEIKHRWQKTLEKYLTSRTSLSGLFLVTDIRHCLNPFDQQMLAWVQEFQLPTHVLLTKADKLSRSAAKLSLLQMQKAVRDFTVPITVQLFSGKDGIGVQEARSQLLKLLSDNNKESK